MIMGLGWVFGVNQVVKKWTNVLPWRGFSDIGSYGAQVSVWFLKNAALAAVTTIFAIGGFLVGCIAGAISGQTTETGFLHGAIIGAVSGAVVAIDLLDSLIDGGFNSKVALFGSLVNGKLFRERISPAILMAYQWELAATAVDFGDLSDIFDISENKVVSLELIEKLPAFKFYHDKMTTDPCDEICCTICLENFKEGECARRLTNCRHFFHSFCIDAWLVNHSSCPVCRLQV